MKSAKKLNITPTGFYNVLQMICYPHVVVVLHPESHQSIFINVSASRIEKAERENNQTDLNTFSLNPILIVDAIYLTFTCKDFC